MLYLVVGGCFKVLRVRSPIPRLVICSLHSRGRHIVPTHSTLKHFAILRKCTLIQKHKAHTLLDLLWLALNIRKKPHSAKVIKKVNYITTSKLYFIVHFCKKKKKICSDLDSAFWYTVQNELGIKNMRNCLRCLIGSSTSG